MMLKMEGKTNMKHLNESQFLEWIEFGRAEAASREHVHQCAECAEQLTALREVLSHVAAGDPGRDLDPAKETQFYQDLQRKIRLLPEPNPFRAVWRSLWRLILAHYTSIGVAVAAVMVFSIVAIYRYDRIFSPQTTPVALQTPISINPVEAQKTALAVADEVASSDVEPSDLIEVSAESNGVNWNEVETNVATEFAQDPFHTIDHLDSKEVSQLKTLLRQQIKGNS